MYNFSPSTCILWNLRLVLLEYCSWLSIRISNPDTLLYRSFISAYCSLIVRSCSVVLCSSFDILSLCSPSLFVWTVLFPSLSAIVCCCLLTVSIRGLIWLSTHDWMLSITEVIVSVILSVRTGTILFKTSGLVRASITLSVTFYLSAGVLAAGFCPISRRSPIEFLLRICLSCCFWVAGKSVGLSGCGLLLEAEVAVEGVGWELVDKMSSLLLFWFTEASILVVVVVDYVDDRFCMK